MGKIDILRLQDNGFIETTNGTIKFGMSLNDLTQILGDVKYIFDYQDNESFKCDNYLNFHSFKLECYFNLKNRVLNDIDFRLIDNESDNRKSYKDNTIEFLTRLTSETGMKEKGRRYFRRLRNAYINLENSNSKNPFVLIKYYKNE